MGLFGTQWIQDMMDVSCGFGSWQLSMNQGLAHMQTVSLMNSCFSPSGFGFMPYSQLNSMNYLLNPNFAAWQASNGISSNSASIFGNWGGMANGYTGGAALNPWGNSWTNPTGSTGSTGKTDKKERVKDTKNENKANELKNLLNKYADYLKNDTNSNNKDIGKEIADKIDALDKNSTSWKDFADELNKIYQNILNGNDASLRTFADFVAKDVSNQLTVGNTTDIVDNLLKKIGLKNDSDATRIANNIQTSLRGLNNNNPNTSVYLGSITNDNLLGVISAYKGSLINDFCTKYDPLEDKYKNDASAPMISIIQNLIAEAKNISEQLKDKRALQDAIAELENNIDVSRGLDTTSLEANFNKLYAIVRVAEAAVLTEQIRAKYETIGGDKLAEKLGYVEKTKDDLKDELNVVNIDTYVGKITAQKAEAIENPLGKGGVANSSAEEVDEPKDDKTIIAEMKSQKVIDETSNKCNEKTVYKENYGQKRSVIIENGKVYVVKQVNGNYEKDNEVASVSTQDFQTACNNAKKRALTEQKLNEPGSDFSKQGDSYTVPDACTTLTKGIEYTIYAKNSHYYIIDNKGDLVELKNDSGVFSIKKSSGKSVEDVNYELQTESDNNLRTKRKNWKNSLKAGEVVTKHTIKTNFTIGKDHWTDDDKVKAFTDGLNDIIDKMVINVTNSGYDNADITKAKNTLKNYYKQAYLALYDVDWERMSNGNHKEGGITNSDNFIYHNCVTDKYVKLSETSSVYRINDEHNASNYNKVTNNGDASSGTGLYVGCEWNWHSRNEYSFFIKPETLLEKFKSFLPD